MAQTAAHAGSGARAGAGVLRGHVTDPTGALIPGAHVVVSTAAGVTVAMVTADSGGAYQVSGLAAGSYILKSSADGFTSATTPRITLAAGQVSTVDVAMAIQAEQQSVTVSDEDTPAVSTDADSNADAVVVEDKDLDSLSDDPDELSNELTALAGPSAGPNGGQIYVGGFSGGQLPPKSAIREIRVNQNPFSAEYDQLGYGRVEILTKPGTDQLHGRFFMQGNDNGFNTGNPFTASIPPYHSVQYDGNLSGSLGKNASFFFNVEQRNNQSANVYSLTDAVENAANTWVSEQQSGSIFNPTSHTEVSPRIDLQLGSKHTLTARYQFERYTQAGALSSQQLPEQSNQSTYLEHTLQLSDSWTVNEHMVNETRYQYERNHWTNSPVATTPTINVSGYFTGGGNSGQSTQDHQDSMELWNITTTSVGTHALKFGTRLRWYRDANWTNSNYNGTFSFTSLASYLTLRNDLTQGKSWTQIATAGGLPTLLSYTTGPNAVSADGFDAALFVQDDWKINNALTLSAGLRWEAQNHIPDHSDFAPRLAFAYALDGHQPGAQAKTVLRGGYGFFYDRLSFFNNIMALHRYSGNAGSQTQYQIPDPTCFDDTSLTNIAPVASLGSECGVARSQAQTIEQLSPSYTSPYVGLASLSLERQLTKTTSVSITGIRSYGVHQLITRDANAYLAGSYAYGSSTLTGTRPDATHGVVQQTSSEGIYKQNQLNANINAHINPRFNFSGYYTLANAHSITGTVSDSWNSHLDYQRSSWRPRHQVFLMGSYMAPWHLTLNPFLVAQSGKPYTFTSPYDLTGDNFYNSRPAVAAAASCAAPQSASTPRYVSTGNGCFDMIPDTTETPIAGGTGNGPGAVAVNLRVSRAIGFGSVAKAVGDGPAPGGPKAATGTRGGSADTGRRYALTFTAQALNLFNDINYGTPVGTVNSTYFGESTSLAGGIFSTSSAARRVFAQAVFSF